MAIDLLPRPIRRLGSRTKKLGPFTAVLLETALKGGAIAFPAGEKVLATHRRALARRGYRVRIDYLDDWLTRVVWAEPLIWTKADRRRQRALLRQTPIYSLRTLSE